VLMESVGCQGKPFRVPHENYGEGPRPKFAVNGEGEQALVKCLRNRKLCADPAAREAALALPSMQLIANERAKASTKGGFKHRSCALVGNAGSLLGAPYGGPINSHNAVVRFNMANFQQFQKHVGNKTNYWVVGHAPSKELCCDGTAKNRFHKVPGSSGTFPGIVLWFPSKQAEIAAACRRRYKGVKVQQIGSASIKKLVAMMNAMRGDGHRLGFGPFGNWLQLTSGAHAILHFVRDCERISMYGFSAWKTSGPDQFTGRQKKVHSGQLFHDWKGESVAWRLMHAAGFIDMCT